MKLLEQITVIDRQSQKHTIDLINGDMTGLTHDNGADVLIVSAFPDDYTPTASSLIGALNRIGISVEALSRDKLEDKRESTYCWTSKQIRNDKSDVPFQYILCYEPPASLHPAEAVGNIFRCLASYAGTGMPITSVAMPLISTGDASIPMVDMIEPLVNTAINWMSNGLPIERLMIVEHSETKAMEMKGALSLLKRMHERSSFNLTARKDYDVFISYCQLNSEEADFLHNELEMSNPGIKIFMDRIELEPGIAWQQKIFNSLIRCRRIVTLYSPQYLASKACQEEFNIAQLLHLSKKDVLFPVYIYNADPLPDYMTFWQYIDCREADRTKIRNACNKLLNTFHKNTI